MMATSTADLSEYFKKGAAVEISSDDDGFRGSWFAGTILRPPKNLKKMSSKVLVQYHTLMEDDAGTRPLREELRLVQLRPLPPRENRKRFNSSEDVDAYYKDGWWEGIITEVLEKDRYLVFFRGSREQLAFKASQLRLHREWVYGKWVPPLELPPDRLQSEEKVAPSTEAEADNEVVEHNFSPVAQQSFGEEGAIDDEVIEHNFSPGTLVEVSSDEDGLEGALFAATILKELDKGRYLVEYQTLKDDDDMKLLVEEVDATHVRPNPPVIDLVDRFEVLEQVDAFYNDGWWRGVVSKVLKCDRYMVYFEDTQEELKYNHSDLRVRQDWIKGKWVVAPKVSHL